MIRAGAQHALAGSERHEHQRPPPSAPDTRVRATEASGQYLTTVAMLALLVPDRVDPRTFAVLYRPFAAPVPFHELLRE